MIAFDYQPITRMVFGPGKIESLGELARELGGHRAMVVSDPGVIAAGHAAKGLQSLERAGLEVLLFHEVHENPTTADVDLGVGVARQFAPDILVGLGGGSSMDCAKGINFLLTNGGRMHDYWGVGKAKLPMLPMIAAPTTSGTGSESQSFALISDAETHVTAYPSGTPVPLASNLNLGARQVVPNLVLCTLGADGAISLRNNSGSVDLVGDVVGYFAPG